MCQGVVDICRNYLCFGTNNSEFFVKNRFFIFLTLFFRVWSYNGIYNWNSMRSQSTELCESARLICFICRRQGLAAKLYRYIRETDVVNIGTVRASTQQRLSASELYSGLWQKPAIIFRQSSVSQQSFKITVQKPSDRRTVV